MRQNYDVKDIASFKKRKAANMSTIDIYNTSRLNDEGKKSL